MPAKKSVKTDKPLAAKYQVEIRGAVSRMYKYLKLEPGCPVLKVQKAIFATVESFYKGKKKLGRNALDNLGFDLGCLWGQTIVDSFGWEWRMADLKGDVFAAIVSPNRAFASAPLGFLTAELHKRYPEDIDCLMVFNKIAGGEFSKGKAKQYHVFA